MYTGGKLLFADHIFNGYGNAKKDFLKQVSLIGYCVYHNLSAGSSVEISGLVTSLKEPLTNPLIFDNAKASHQALTF